jgi:hypothetical protein
MGSLLKELTTFVHATGRTSEIWDFFYLPFRALISHRSRRLLSDELANAIQFNIGSKPRPKI